jgi:glycosyltransferase involved in cell wall biosynthesis
MVNYEYPPLGGGGGVCCRQLAEALVPKHDVTVLTSQFTGQQSSEIIQNVNICRVPVMMRSDLNAASLASMVSFLPSSLLSGLRTLNLKSFEIIHSFFAIPSAPSGLLIAKALNKPHILSLMGGDVYDPSKKLSPHNTPVLHAVVKNAMNMSDRVVALSSDIRDRAYHHYRPSTDIDLIPLGIPQPFYDKKPREAFGLDNDDIVLITIGRLVTRKAVHELISMLDTIQDPHVKLVVIGDGPERQHLENMAGRLGLADRVIFAGFVSDEEKFQLLDISDCYVSTSEHEGFGIVFLEAMVCGLPVICYDEGGQVDFLKNDITGYVVSLGNVTDFRNRLVSLVRNDALRSAMGARNQDYVKHQYLISTCAEQYQRIYEQIKDKSKG